MPRKEGPPLEERMQRAKELAEKKARIHKENLQKLYSSRLYKIARKSCIAFLWLTQLILIDWILPYRTSKDYIADGYFKSISSEKAIETPVVFRPSEVFIKTGQGNRFYIDYPEESLEVRLNDSIVLHRSYLLNDIKKMSSMRTGESFTVTGALTHDFLPVIFIFAALACMFVFVKNIEVKAFAWICLLCTSVFGVFVLVHIVLHFY